MRTEHVPLPEAETETAVFTLDRRRRRGRWATFLLLLLLLGVLYTIARDILYARFVHGYAQAVLNDLVNASAERIASISIDRQGDVIIRDADVYIHHRGVRRLFYRAELIRVVLDGLPLRDSRLRVMRIDLHRPEIFLRREPGADWNVLYALERPPAPEKPELAPDDPRRYYRPPDAGFPPNGIHIHDGTVHVTYASKSGKEATWTATDVRAAIRRSGGITTLHPASGNFYGGLIRANAEISRTSPFTLDQFIVEVKNADVARMVEGAWFVKRPMSGSLNAVIAVTRDVQRTQGRPIASGRCEISEGNLWEFPALAGVLSLLTLTSVSERKIDSAVLEFTYEEDHIRIDKMHFLGYPISLFGDGVCGLAGEFMHVVFVPRLGKSHWESILSIIGTPIQLLLDIVGGVIVPVVLRGSFDKPEFTPQPFEFLVRPSIRQLIEERSPK
jgi:hypothetical protein